MEWGRQQRAALQAVDDWLQRGTPQVFRLFGYAGSGKTTLARHLAEGVEGRVIFAAFTGKAAYVLRTKGCRDATTIHKLIYLPKSKSHARLLELREKLEQLPGDHPDRHQLTRDIEAEEKNLSRPAFSLNLDSELRHARLLVVDEVSMVDERIGRDLESFGKQILVLGDPAQLPPVYGTGYFTEQEPDIMLTEIHRQAQDNPIIHLATRIRERELPALGTYGGSRIIRGMDAEMALECDQMIVGRNATRAGFNKRVRTLKGLDPANPAAGDKLVCLRNNHEVGLLNGAIWFVDRLQEQVGEDMVDLLIYPEGGEERLACFAHRHYFRGEKPPWWALRDAEEFDYGYALTAHKSQGSQWDHVLIYDESALFRNDRWRWLYTAVTRAAERVDLVRVA